MVLLLWVIGGNQLGCLMYDEPPAGISTGAEQLFSFCRHEPLDAIKKPCGQGRAVDEQTVYSAVIEDSDGFPPSP